MIKVAMHTVGFVFKSTECLTMRRLGHRASTGILPTRQVTYKGDVGNICTLAASLATGCSVKSPV